ncbi:MAG: nucleoside-diphosphate kinase [Deltaproteobacteria bacterium]|nr:nucleoside-diphosphate kinase [Deltaproteobacteria bacterium]MBK8236398.1 nucleoside-diphosphate kinase [Deltaproteobacteria bacterium]MBK8717982.1 nucleoside-diphosphate kinase [Deltaproteobacteria bacterium]MBP7290149.1 nucleoside-diphosphate kinase [Nannocystaceae bacterium]
MQRTLALVKPDAYAAGHHGAIAAKIQETGLRIVAMKTLQLSRAQAEGFYHVHSARPFFGDLCKFMTEGKILALVLEGDDAIARWRGLMGPTDATKAPKDTIRGQFGTNVERNATHGSDATETAAFEIGYFFAGLELV